MTGEFGNGINRELASEHLAWVTTRNESLRRVALNGFVWRGRGAVIATLNPEGVRLGYVPLPDLLSSRAKLADVLLKRVREYKPITSFVVSVSEQRGTTCILASVELMELSKWERLLVWIR